MTLRVMAMRGNAGNSVKVPSCPLIDVLLGCGTCVKVSNTVVRGPGVRPTMSPI
jgi:hypothetical protein